MKPKKAGKRYGLSEYPMTLSIFPKLTGNEAMDLDLIQQAMWRNAPGFKSIKHLQRCEREEIPGFCTHAIVYHTPGWEMYVEYEV